MPLHIRHARPDDLDALLEISLRTGDGGQDAAPLHQDGRLIGLIYVAPYLTYAPKLAFVVCDGPRVLGFTVGAVDTRDYERWAEAYWWPDLRARYPDPSPVPEAERTADQHRIHAIHHPHLVPEEVARPYPAHAHMNLAAEARGQGAGSRLLTALLDALEQAGAHAVHVGVDPRNRGGLGFWRARGFADVSGVPDAETVWLGRPVRMAAN